MVFAAHAPAIHPAHGWAIHPACAARLARARAEESPASDFQAGFPAAARPVFLAGLAGLRTDRSASQLFFSIAGKANGTHSAMFPWKVRQAAFLIEARAARLRHAGEHPPLHVRDLALRCLAQAPSLCSHEAPVPFDSSVCAWVTTPLEVETIAVIRQNGE